MADKVYLTPYEKRKLALAKRKKQQQAAAQAAQAESRAKTARQTKAGIPARVGPNAGKPQSPEKQYRYQTPGMGYGAMAGVSAGRNAQRSRAAQTSRLSGMAASYPKKPSSTSSSSSTVTKTPLSNTGSSTASSSATARSNTSGSSGRGSGPAKKPKPSKPVLQQNTMWVKAVDSPTGKGYLAQRGKPEKRVTGRVKIQEATTSGKAAGSTYAYKAGKTVKKVGKK